MSTEMVDKLTRRIYFDLLRRSPEPSALANASSLMIDTDLGAETLIRHVIFSEEFFAKNLSVQAQQFGSILAEFLQIQAVQDENHGSSSSLKHNIDEILDSIFKRYIARLVADGVLTR